MIIQANGFHYEIKKEKNLHMDGKYIVIYFEDGYQNALVEYYRWSEVKAENEVDKEIEKYLQNSGIDCHVIWADREVFLIENLSFNIQDVANGLRSMFNHSDITEKNETGLFSKFSRLFSLNKK